MGLARQVELELDPLTGVGKAATGLDVIRSAVARSTIRLVAHEPITRVGEDPEGVHQARVAVRRLRSDLRTFRPLLDRDWAEALRVELRWLGGLLAPVRDAEVLGVRLQGRIEGMVGLELASAKVLLDRLETDRLEAGVGFSEAWIRGDTRSSSCASSAPPSSRSHEPACSIDPPRTSDHS